MRVSSLAGPRPVVMPALLVVLLGSIGPLLMLLAAIVAPSEDPAAGSGRLALGVARQVLMVAVVVPAELVVGSVMALLLPQRGPLLPVACTLLLLPLLAPPAVAAIVGGELVDMLGPLLGILVTDLWRWAGLVTVPGLLAFSTLPANLRDAAIVDGLGVWGWCRYVGWPRLAPVILVAGATRIAGILGATAEPLGAWRDHADLALGTPGIVLAIVGGVTGGRAAVAMLLTILALGAAVLLLRRLPPDRPAP